MGDEIKVTKEIKEITEIKGDVVSAPEQKWREYFPYEPRLDQEGIADFVSKNISENAICIVEAPYGIGKSIAMLSAALASGKKVVFATCNNAAHNSIVDEVLKINKKFDKNLTVASIIGKGKLCLHPNFTYDFCDSMRQAKECKYFNNVAEKMAGAVSEIEFTVKKKPHELLYHPFSKFVYGKAIEHQVCPYELMISLAARADVVILDYFHIFTSLYSISKKKMAIDPRNSVLFIDEADELKERMLSHLTKQISAIGLQRLKEQARKTKGIDDNDIRLISNFQKVFQDLFNDRQGYFDIGKDEIMEVIRDNFGDYDKFVGDLVDIIERISKHAERVASRPDLFLELLPQLPIDQFCYGLKEEQKGQIGAWRESLMISNYELYNADLMQIEGKRYRIKEVLEDFSSAVLFSATIGNVEIFKKGIGLDYADYFSSKKFNTENFKVILKKDITSLYKTRKEMAPKVIDDVKFCSSMNDGVLIAMPSFASSFDIVPHLDAKSIDNVKECTEGVYYAILGGKGSRGINKAAKLSTVYIYGLQLPQPDDYLFMKRREYLLKKYPRDVAYKFLYANVVSKACQVAGRIFRSRHKKGIVIFADSRYRNDAMQGDFFYNCFPAYFKDRMLEMDNQQKFEAAVSIFWGKLPSQGAEARLFGKQDKP